MSAAAEASLRRSQVTFWKAEAERYHRAAVALRGVLGETRRVVRLQSWATQCAERAAAIGHAS